LSRAQTELLKLPLMLPFVLPWLSFDSSKTPYELGLYHHVHSHACAPLADFMQQSQQIESYIKVVLLLCST
jgi:hypothetical protein